MPARHKIYIMLVKYTIYCKLINQKTSRAMGLKLLEFQVLDSKINWSFQFADSKSKLPLRQPFA
jgi:hypothetical protein